MPHSLFIQYEIGCMQIDDFCNLPANRVIGIVYATDDKAYARHELCFDLTH